MAQSTEHEKVISGSPTVPRSVRDPPGRYEEFQPTATSERTDDGSDAANASVLSQSTDCETKLSTLLNDIEEVITFAKYGYSKPRIVTLMNLKENVENDKSVLEAAENSLDSLHTFIKMAVEYITSCVGKWDELRQYYSQALDDPSQNEDLQSHFSKTSQESYEDLLKKMKQLCCKIERELRLVKSQLRNVDELSVETRKIIQQFRKKVDTNSGEVEKLFNEQYVAVYCSLEQIEQSMNIFKGEWQNGCKGFDNASPRLSASQQLPSAKYRESSPHSDENNLPKSQIDSFTPYPPKTKENRPQAVQDIVGRYDALQVTVRDEVNNMKDQQQFINWNEVELEKRATKK